MVLPPHPREDEISEICQEHGMIFREDVPVYREDSLGNLPEYMRKYWEEKSRAEISEEELKEIGDEILRKHNQL